MAKTFEEIVKEEKAKFKIEGKRTTPAAPGAELTLSDVDPLIPVPKLQEVKSRIAGRGTLTDELVGIAEDVAPFSSRAENPIVKQFLQTQEIPFEILRKGALSSITALRSAESGISSALMAGLEGKPENMAKEFVQGVTGQKITRLADLIRVTGAGGEGFVGEAVAEIGGFIAGLGLTNLATAGKISQGANMVQQSLKRAAVKGAKKKSFFFRDKAKAFINGFDDAFSNMRGEFDKLYSKIGNKVIGGDDAVALQDAVTSMPKDVASKLSKIKGVNFLDKTQRVLEPTINNAKIIKDQISRTIPKNVWNGIDDGGANAALYREMKDSYFKLNDVIANNAGSLRTRLLQLNKKYTSLNRFSEKLQPIFRNKAGLIKTNVRGVRSEANQDMLKQLRRFSNIFFKDGKVVLRDIDKMNKSISFHKGITEFGRRTGPIAVGSSVAVGVGASILRKPISEFVGGGSAPRSGGGG